MSFQFGIDQLLQDSARLKKLQSQRIGLVAHPASITSHNLHTIDALIAAGCKIDRAFGPQHGMRGDKQDNMIESEDYLDPVHMLPVVSLYGEHRHPTEEMLQGLDVILFDLQDIGCRIYTYLTTLSYFITACARFNVELWVLDRPNPAGRPVDGLYLEEGQQSFVGSAPIPTRHGLTIGELAVWFRDQLTTESLSLTVIAMTGYDPQAAPGYGWPQRPWVNPSPNASSVNMARCFPGTVLLEGTTLSEGRGTTTPLEVIGAPDLAIRELLACIAVEIPDWSKGIFLRECFFSPTFHKHEGALCAGIQFHTDFPGYTHDAFKPYRLVAGLLKLIRQSDPEVALWRHHNYEYEPDRLPIDVINGGSKIREWVDDPGATFAELDSMLSKAEASWQAERAPYLIY